jgi:hypothetical protein
MGERVGGSFRAGVLAITLCGVLTIAGACAMLANGMLVDGLLVGAAAILLLRWYWRATARKRALVGRGFYPGRRVGAHWNYEELHDGVIVALELPLEYVGRGEYDIHIPSERDWMAAMPPWAHGRRDEIVERLQSVFKRSQIHFDADGIPSPE